MVRHTGYLQGFHGDRRKCRSPQHEFNLSTVRIELHARLQP
ncbi:MAG: hypothetical protein QOE71_3106, partial [Pseudonocardiales bacterium]|nr:hypothetical protein [Pseudonocardiales bacterium]